MFDIFFGIFSKVQKYANISLQRKSTSLLIRFSEQIYVQYISVSLTTIWFWMIIGVLRSRNCHDDSICDYTVL